MTKKLSGFTLIELLIVVAIIGILAALAVPNFLNAQVRAKVARAQGDMRTISMAMEQYLVDWSTYPLPWDNGPGTYPTVGVYAEKLKVIVALTTPASYVSEAMLIDPFARSEDALDTYYQFGIGRRGDEDGNRYRLANIWAGNWSDVYPTNVHVILSQGPDAGRGLRTRGGDDSIRVTRYSTGTDGLLYDPTNGTISDGDIYYFGNGYIPESMSIYEP
jgi:prepilin-type N-terminal cleavage/methylation domain-containing protein